MSRLGPWLAYNAPRIFWALMIATAVAACAGLLLLP